VIRIVLVNPPAGDPTRPYLSTPSLTGALRRAGFAASQCDLAIDAYEYLFAPRRLAQALERVARRLEEIEGSPFLQGEQHVEWADHVRAVSSGPYVQRQIGRALGALRDEKSFIDRDRYRECIALLQRAQELVSASRYPSRFYAPGIYAGRHPAFSAEGLLQAAEDRSENIFLEFFEAEAVPRLLAERPEAIFISANHSGQLIPAMTLARLLRSAAPEVHLNLWGNYAFHFADVFPSWPRFFDSFHSVAPFEWEYGSTSTFIRLAQALESGADLTAVPGIAFRDSSGSVVVSERQSSFGRCCGNWDSGHPERRAGSGVEGPSTPPRYARAERIPNRYADRHSEEVRAFAHRWRAPARTVERGGGAEDAGLLSQATFEGLPLDRYLSPAPVLPLALTVGCHWGRCVFCTRQQPYAARAVRECVEQMQRLSELHGARHFYFADDCIPPDSMEELCRALVERGSPFDWYCMIRPEKRFDAELTKLMRRAGCRHVFLGLESASQRLLNLMCKGTQVQQVRGVVRDLAGAGISVILSAFVGFPTETEVEARETLDFLVENRPFVSHAVCERFLLQAGTPLYEQRQRFGIEEVRRAPGEAGYDLWFRSRGGMTPERVTEVGAEIVRTLNELYPQPNLQALLLSYSHCGHTLLKAAGASAGRSAPRAPLELSPAARLVFDPDRAIVRELRFPCDRAFVAAERFKAASLHQGHQRWSARAEPALETAGRTEPRRSICVYAGATDQYIEIGDAAWKLARLCDGSRSAAEIAERLPSAQRDAALALLRDLVSRGVLAARGPESAQIPTSPA
jgi:hypothetical protein